MSDIQDRLAELKELCEKVGNFRSDDFGHDTQALLLAESRHLTEFVEDICPKLIKALRLAKQDLTSIANGVGANNGKAANLAKASLEEIQQILCGEGGGE